MFHSIRPYGGVACLELPDDLRAALTAWVAKAAPAGAVIERKGTFTILTRTGSLPGSASWTHQWADPGNTVCSKDKRVFPPFRILWFGTPLSSFDRHVRGPSPQVVAGRTFVVGTDGLSAFDVYTGRPLWTTDIPSARNLKKIYAVARSKYSRYGVMGLGGPCVSLSDGVYVAGGESCVRLDPATGKELSEFKLPQVNGKRQIWGSIRISGDVLIGAVNAIILNPERLGGSTWEGGASTRLTAFDRNTSAPLWSIDAEQGFGHNAIAAGNGKVFCVDLWPDTSSGTFVPSTKKGRLLALDATTGKELWSTRENVFGSWQGYVEKHDVLVHAMEQGLSRPMNGSTRGAGYRGADGTLLWQEGIGNGPWLLRGSMILDQVRYGTTSGAFDLASGKPVLRRDDKTGRIVPIFRWFRQGKGCSYAIAGEHLVLFRGDSVGYWNLRDDTGPYKLHGLRIGCTNSAIPADGVLSILYLATNCTCRYPVRTSIALIPTNTKGVSP